MSDISRASEIISSPPIHPPLPNPYDIDELLGFNCVLRKGIDEEKNIKSVESRKIFINHIDSFTGKYIIKVSI